jgi:signal transduction histidine kinase
MLGATAREKGVALTFRFADDVHAFVVGDPLRLGQVLLNLVSNAVKFTSEGSVEVTVEQRASTESEVELAFAISDTGIGLGPEQIGRLMQPFSQADTSTTRKYGGTGLGLAISLRLVTAMGGTLTIECSSGDDRAQIVVHDRGRGMTEETRVRCTDPFYTTARDQGGTGLGLFVVRNIVESELGGRLALDTGPGLGTRWTVQLPAAAVAS